MENPILEIMNTSFDNGYEFGARKGLDFIKLLRHDGDVMTVEDIIERYEKQFNLVKNENGTNIESNK